VGNTELMNVNGLGQVRVTQMNGSSRKRCSSCVDDEVCANPVRSKKKERSAFNRSRPQLQKHELALLVNWGQERELRSGPFYAFVVFR